MAAHLAPGTEDLARLAQQLVGAAQPGEQLEVVLGRSTSTTVKVYDGQVESLTSAGSNGAGVRVLRDGRQGFAHCGSLDPEVLHETLAEARDNVAFGEPDEWNAVAEPDGGAYAVSKVARLPANMTPRFLGLLTKGRNRHQTPHLKAGHRIHGLKKGASLHRFGPVLGGLTADVDFQKHF